MPESNHFERDFERLSKAITEAVMKSEKVRKIVGDIQKKENICPRSFMVLVLNLQGLIGAVESNAPEETPVRKPSRRPKKKKASEYEQYIDGRKLTKNEIAFQEYINERFNDESWLRDHGIIL